ncbi:ATP synthase subunit C [Dapis sp. BLCC M126]|uniref:ATP synthase subunit C n=1 Tax=Dapis sp. BLCC M126 TaxID=3400189 RepID=UPI003CF6DD50
MDEFVILLGWFGLYSAVGLGAIGSAIGCTIAGQAAIGAMIELKGGYGRFVGLSALPSSMSIYGIVVMFALDRPNITAEAAGGLFGIGLGAGLAFLLTAVYQGLACASAIAAAKDKPEIFGLALAPAAIVEGFAVFALVFALVLGQGIPQ